jgi:hypothetical protein
VSVSQHIFPRKLAADSTTKPKPSHWVSSRASCIQFPSSKYVLLRSILMLFPRLSGLPIYHFSTRLSHEICNAFYPKLCNFFSLLTSGHSPHLSQILFLLLQPVNEQGQVLLLPLLLQSPNQLSFFEGSQVSPACPSDKVCYYDKGRTGALVE